MIFQASATSNSLAVPRSLSVPLTAIAQVNPEIQASTTVSTEADGQWRWFEIAFILSLAVPACLFTKE